MSVAHVLPLRLFQDDKDTKFESNSQLMRRGFCRKTGCFRTTKIQNLRAIHNTAVLDDALLALFQDDKDTKFESNSQQQCFGDKGAWRCFRTTKIQNLRAIHNTLNE